MTLYEICMEIAKIEEGLACGKIRFSYDNLMSAMKPGHPADLLDNVLSEIGWDVFDGNDVSLERVKEWLKELQAFKADFKIRQLSAPIKHVQEYIKEQEKANNG